MPDPETITQSIRNRYGGVLLRWRLHPALREGARWPRMAALAEAAEKLPAFTQNKLPA